MTVLLITGTREPLTRLGEMCVERHIMAASSRLVLVGDCRTGVDAFVKNMADNGLIETKTFFADWYPNGSRVLDKSAGPRRNRAMVDHAVELEAGGFGDRVQVLGFPIKGSRGTFDCMRQAREAGLIVTETDVSMHVRNARSAIGGRRG